MRILVVEDETDLNRMIKQQLKDVGYGVDSCFNGEEALDYLSVTDYDLIITDIMMPQKDGLTLIKELREEGKTVPVLFLSAKDSVEDRVQGLDCGGDDYLVKPFAFAELLARIRVLLRKNSGIKTNRLTAGDLIMDVDTHTVQRGGRNIVLSAKEFQLLHYLLVNKGIVLSRERLANHIWDFGYDGVSNIIDVYIRYLRKKIDEGFDQPLIHTVRGRGYMLKE